MNKKGGIIDAFLVLFVGGILGVVIVNVFPVLIDNNIVPLIENREFGSVGILLWNLVQLVYVVIVLIAAFIALQTPGQGLQQ